MLKFAHELFAGCVLNGGNFIFNSSLASTPTSSQVHKGDLYDCNRTWSALTTSPLSRQTKKSAIKLKQRIYDAWVKSITALNKFRSSFANKANYFDV